MEAPAAELDRLALFGVPWRRRGNQASGTPSVRPSSKSTQKLCSSKRTDKGSGEVVMPGVPDLVPMLLDHPRQFALLA
jgi:hypothetical protein